MKSKKIGHYQLGAESIKITIHDGEGGFFSHSASGEVAHLSIGAHSGDWPEFVGVLHHEAMEFAMWRRGHRYTDDPDKARDNGARIFVMTHTQFSEVSAQVGAFMANCLPDACRAFKAFHSTVR
jgi:hypothetical protein